MKKLLLGLMLILSIGIVSCYDDTELRTRVEELEKNAIASIQEQINAIKKSITSLESVDDELKKTIVSLENSIDVNRAMLDSLKIIDASLEIKIENLSSQLDEEITSIRIWMDSTFVTVDTYNSIVEDLNALKETISSDYEELNTKIDNSVDSIKEWVNKVLEGYYTSEEVDAKFKELTAELEVLKIKLNSLFREFTIIFEDDDIGILPGGTTKIGYTIIGATDKTIVKAIGQNGWSAKVIPDSIDKGIITVSSPGILTDDDIVVLVYDGEYRTIMSSLNFVKGVISLPNDAYELDAEEGSVDVIVRTNHIFNIDIPDESKEWLSVENTKSISDKLVTFSYSANHYELRRSDVRITDNANNKIATITFLQKGDGSAQDDDILEGGVNLSAKGTSNCYIVPSEGQYKFLCNVIGNGDKGIIHNTFHTSSAAIKPSKVGVIYSEPENLIDSIYIEDNYINFKATDHKGNAIIAVYNETDEGDEILWSWHLWFTDKPNEIKLFGETFLDRNLGAYSSEKNNTVAETGLFYQWGRKDPFSKEVKNVTNIDIIGDPIKYMILHPDTYLKSSNGDYSRDDYYNGIGDNYLWGNPDSHLGGKGSKTIYDPCPVGYKVPSCKWMYDNFSYPGSAYTRYERYDSGILLYEDPYEMWLPIVGEINQFGSFTNEQTHYHSDYLDTEYSFGFISIGIDFSGGASTWINNILKAEQVRCMRENDGETLIPNVITKDAINITTSSADINCEIPYNGNSVVLSYGIKWGLKRNQLEFVSEITGFPYRSEYQVLIEDLPANTKIYYQAFAKNINGEGVGQIMSFETQSGVEQGLTDLNELYVKLFQWGISTSGNYHQCFGISSSTLAAELMGEDFIMSSMGNGWFWYDCLYDVKDAYTSKVWRSEDLWNTYYSWITLANKIISDLNDSQSSRKDYILGQAYGIRAYSYFMLAQWFSRTYVGHESEPCVPLFITYQESLDNNKPRSTVKQVYDQIIKDIDNACQMLESPDKSGLYISKHENSRLNKYSVNGIKARICLVLEDWSGALEASKIAQEGSNIGTNADIFNGINDITRQNVIWGADIYRDEASTSPTFFAHVDHNAGSYASSSLKMINKELYNHMSNSDVRRNWWNADYSNNKHKYADPRDMYRYNYIWMRHEEMVLIEAEAECRLGNYNVACSVLERLVKTRDVNYSCNKTGTSLGELTTDKTGSLLEEIIMQRRIELWGENGRVYDIRRLKQGFVRTQEQGWPYAALLKNRSVQDPETYDWVMTIPLSAFEKNPSLDINTDQNPL